MELESAPLPEGRFEGRKMGGGTVRPGKALVIGSGIGGLSTAILLAKLNYQVTVIEGNEQPGGLMRSYRRQGVECPVGVHYVGSLGKGEPLRRMLDHLGVGSEIPVERMGRDGTIDRYLFDDQFSFSLPEGIDAFEERLRQTFPDEQRQITEVMVGLRDVAARMYSLDFLCTAAVPLFALQYAEALEERLNKLGCSPRLRAVLGVATTLMGVSPPECPVFYHHMALASLLFSSWRLACDCNRMVDAFLGQLQKMGGSVLAGDSVTQIKIREKAVTGVVLQSGQELEAPLIVAAIHPRLMLNLLSEQDIRSAYRERILHLTDTEGIFSVNLAVDARRHAPWSHNLYRLKTDETGRARKGVFYQLRRGTGDTNLLTLMTSSSIKEWQRWEATKSGQRGNAYEEAKEGKADVMIKEALSFCGPFNGLKTLDVFTPLTLRDWTNCPDGTAYGVRRSTGQFLQLVSLQRPAAGGLYLAGQNAWSPGIIGTVLGSFQVVKQIIGFNRFQEELIRGSEMEGP
jgi:all-trans-retinol 13,14-reductase